MTQYIVKGPLTGKWMRGPMQGATANLQEAHLYHDGDNYLEILVNVALDRGLKLILREVPAPRYVECPDCEGVGDSRERPYYECHRCGGAGRLEVRGPTCIHGNRGPCLTCGTN